MSRPSILIALGILVILVPLSGFPIAFRSLFEIVLGVAILAIGLALRAQEMHKPAAAAPAEHAPEPAPTPVDAIRPATEEEPAHEAV